jgi:hypothetical protein
LLLDFWLPVDEWFAHHPSTKPGIMARKYLGGSGSALTVWISLAASTVLVFYGYDQVSTVFH